MSSTSELNGPANSEASGGTSVPLSFISPSSHPQQEEEFTSPARTIRPKRRSLSDLCSKRRRSNSPERSSVPPTVRRRLDESCPSQHASDEAGPSNADSVCDCCFANPRDNLQCPQGHHFCNDCLQREARRVIDTGEVFHKEASTLQCLASDCQSPLAWSVIAAVLDGKTSSKLEERMTLRLVMEAEQLPKHKLFKCPHCGVFFDLLSGTRRFPRDKYHPCMSTCVKCKAEWKKGHKCEAEPEEAEAEYSGDPHTVFDQILERSSRVLIDGITKRCPGCSTIFCRTNCNKVKCKNPTCQYQAMAFCFLCGTSIGKGRKAYEHFCKHPRHAEGKCSVRCGSCKKSGGVLTKHQSEKAAKEFVRSEVERVVGAFPGLREIFKAHYPR